MKKRLTVLLALTFVLVGTLAFAGCSNSSSDTSDTSSENNPDDVLIVGMECDYAPYNWTTTTENDYTVPISDADFADGYDVALAQKIADGLGQELEVKPISWEGLIPALQNKEIDLIIAGMTDTEERREAVSFTEPYYESEMVVVVSKESAYANATDIQDFSGAQVIGQANTIYDEVIDQIDGVEHMAAQTSFSRMILSVSSGEADALVGELPAAKGAIAANPDLMIIRFEDGHGFEADTSVSIAVNKDNSDLETQVNDILAGISTEDREVMMEEAIERQPSSEEATE